MTDSTPKSNERSMSMVEALAKLKLLYTRAGKACVGKSFCHVCIGQDTLPPGYTSIEDYNRDVQSEFDKIIAIFNEVEALQKAINLSNATTEVTIGGSKYTISEALAIKNSFNSDRASAFKFRASFVNTLKDGFNAAIKDMEIASQKMREQIQDTIDNLAENDASAVETDPKIKPFIDQIESTSKPVLYNPLGIEKKYKDTFTDVEDFILAVDVAITTTNASNIIKYKV
ncbi:MAG: hypothetical protein GY804_08545 [Alphaproteobacteria bacterium]|nr:hypothetical protein [Alphaproteobacteria bacterium]